MDLIDRQAAIRAVNTALFPKINTAKDAEKALRDLPSAQSEYRLDEWCTDCKEYDTEKHCCPRFNQVIRTTLDEMKSERKKGKWKTALLDHEAFGVRPKVLCCSECNQCIAYPTRYCPNCGAKMEENV